MYYDTFESEIGNFFLISNGHALVGCYLEGQKYFPNEVFKYQKNETLPIFLKAKKWLTKYLEGEVVDNSNLPIEILGTQFRKEVWNILRSITYGNTMTYKHVSNILIEKNNLNSMSNQAVGSAVGHNPLLIFIPCHRVIGSNGKLKGYAAGIEVKQYLLELESNTIKKLL